MRRVFRPDSRGIAPTDIRISAAGSLAGRHDYDVRLLEPGEQEAVWAENRFEQGRAGPFRAVLQRNAVVAEAITDGLDEASCAPVERDSINRQPTLSQQMREGFRREKV
jgi:hypothetical protein